MTSEEIAAITRERLAGWTEQLVAAHSTPLLLLAAGHDHAAGQITLITLEDIGDEDLLACVAAVLRRLRPAGPVSR